MNEWKTRCELALMGKVVPVNDNSEVQKMTEYMLGVINPQKKLVDDFLGNSINKYEAKYKVKYIVCNVLMDMFPCITYLLENDHPDEGDWSYEFPKPFEETYGSGYPSAFCYVFNTVDDWCSEFGDCFFEKRADGYYHRVS